MEEEEVEEENIFDHTLGDYESDHDDRGNVEEHYEEPAEIFAIDDVQHDIQAPPQRNREHEVIRGYIYLKNSYYTKFSYFIILTNNTILYYFNEIIILAHIFACYS